MNKTHIFCIIVIIITIVIIIGSNQEQFGLVRDNDFVISGDSDYCIHPMGGSEYPSHGTDLVWWKGDCDKPKVRFYFDAQNKLRQATSNMCVYTDYNGARNGDRLHLADANHDGWCESGYNFVSNPSRLRHPNGKYIHPEGGAIPAKIGTSSGAMNNLRAVVWDDVGNWRDNLNLRRSG